jgi:hypothetical protein
MKMKWIMKPDNTFETAGVDYGPKGIEFAYRVADVLVMLWPGYNTWAGVGKRTYHKAEWVIVKVLKEVFVESDCHLTVDEIAAIPVGSRSKKTLTDAKKLAHEHAAFKPFDFMCPSCEARTVRSVDYKSTVSIPCDACGAETTFVCVEGIYSPKPRARD